MIFLRFFLICLTIFRGNLFYVFQSCFNSASFVSKYLRPYLCTTNWNLLFLLLVHKSYNVRCLNAFIVLTSLDARLTVWPDLNKSKKVLTSTTKTSKYVYIPKRPRICINWNPPFQIWLQKFSNTVFLFVTEEILCIIECRQTMAHYCTHLCCWQMILNSGLFKVNQETVFSRF